MIWAWTLINDGINRGINDNFVKEMKGKISEVWDE